jgi:hypothetical protein
MDYALKALDSVAGANYERKDLSSIITMQDGPQRPLLRSIGVTRAKGKTHYWDEVGLIKPGTGAATYAEGGKPPADVNAPVQLSNVVCRIGKTAQVTDTMSAIWTGAGEYTLKDGELERLYTQAMDFQVALKSLEVMNEAEWMLLNGDKTNPQAFAGGQCDGVLKFLSTNVVAAGATSNPFDVSAANAASFEQQVKALALKIRNQYTPTVPGLAIVTAGQKSGINAFIGGGAGRPLVQVINNGDNKGFVGGAEVDQYQTGYFKVDIEIEPQLELGARSAVSGQGILAMLDVNHISRADLIPFSREPLARISTTLEAMVTWEFTLEFRNQKSSGVVTGLNA